MSVPFLLFLFPFLFLFLLIIHEPIYMPSRSYVGVGGSVVSAGNRKEDSSAEECAVCDHTRHCSLHIR